jgi:hypothetical protein
VSTEAEAARITAAALAGVAKHAPGYRVPRRLRSVVIHVAGGYADVQIEGSPVVIHGLPWWESYAGGAGPKVGDVAMVEAIQFDHVLVDRLYSE